MPSRARPTRGSHAVEAKALALNGEPRASAPLGHSLLRIAPDPLGEKGLCAVATRDLAVGEVVHVEAPLLCSAKPSLACEMKLKSLATHLSASSDAELQTVQALLVMKFSFLRACIEAPADIRKKVCSLQTEFADPNSSVSRAAVRLASQLHEAGLFSGLGSNGDGIFAGGEALSEQGILEILTNSLVNNFDFMPDGSEANFYRGSLLEHSCSPNVRMYIVLAPHSPPVNGAQKLPPDAWVGEWRAIVKIRAGEPVCQSYLEDAKLAENCRTRRQALMKRMGFLCACSRCREESERVVQPNPYVKRDVNAAAPILFGCKSTLVPISWADPFLQRCTHHINDLS